MITKSWKDGLILALTFQYFPDEFQPLESKIKTKLGAYTLDTLIPDRVLRMRKQSGVPQILNWFVLWGA